MLRTSLTRTATRSVRGTRGFAAEAAEEKSGGGGVGVLLALGALAAAGYYVYANDLLDDIIVRGRGGGVRARLHAGRGGAGN